MIFRKKEHTEKTLINDCIKGKMKAQKELYACYADLMLAICLRYVADRLEAEDLMIQGFTKVFDKLGQYKFEGSFEGWLRRVFVNECLMYLRKQKHYMTPIETADRESVTAWEETSLETQDLLQLVQELPAGYRTVFNLYAIEGYNHKEIAEQLGISEGTSKSQLSKARGMLQRWLTDLEKNTLTTYQTT